MKGLRLRNFKSLLDADIKVGHLTLLAGLNGSGKSSVIQSLLLLRQSFGAGQLAKGYLLTAGDLVDLGRPSDVLAETAPDDTITIQPILSDELSAPMTFRVGNNAAHATDFPTLQNSLAACLADQAVGMLLGTQSIGSDTSQQFQYLQAERLGPRKFLPVGSASGVAPSLGTRGEYVLQILQLTSDVKMGAEDPRLLTSDSLVVRAQVDEWLGAISPGARLNWTELSTADLLVGTYSFGMEGALRSKEFRPTNVGFGLSYALPVIAALLITQPGGVVFLENPEAHIHPLGQTLLGQLCAKAAAAGVTVLLETHSDHLMDGVRIAVREGMLPPESVAFNYFEREGSRSTVSTPTIDPDGKLSSWPKNFFDQHRRNTAKLIAPKSK